MAAKADSGRFDYEDENEDEDERPVSSRTPPATYEACEEAHFYSIF